MNNLERRIPGDTNDSFHLSAQHVLTNSTTSDLFYPAISHAPALTHFFLLALSRHSTPYAANCCEGPPLLVYLEKKLDSVLKDDNRRGQAQGILKVWINRIRCNLAGLFRKYSAGTFFGAAFLLECFALHYAE